MRDVPVRIELPPDEGRDETELRGPNPMEGARVANLTPALADEMQTDLSARGVVVVGVAGQSQAARFGFQTGDIIRAVNGQAIRSVAQLHGALASADAWRMSIQRGDQTLELSVE
jgi:S1-C subfamily serine protease